MKKLILSAALLAGMTFVACSSDDDKGGSGGCQTCEMTMGGQTISEEVCKGDNGNAFVDDEDQGISYSQYIQAFEAGGGECN